MTITQQAEVTVSRNENPIYTWGVLSLTGLNRDLGRVREVLKSDELVASRIRDFNHALEVTALGLTIGHLNTLAIFELTKVSERFKAYIDDSDAAHMLVVDEILAAV